MENRLIIINRKKILDEVEEDTSIKKYLQVKFSWDQFF